MTSRCWPVYIALLLAVLLPMNLVSAASPTPQPAPQLQGLLAFPVFDTDATREIYRIYTLDLATGERKMLLENASQPAFSHNGKAIAYKSWKEDQQVYGLHAAELRDIAGTDWRFMASLGAQRPQWSANDAFFYFHSRHESDRLDRVMITQGPQSVSVFRPDMDNKELLGKSPAVVSTAGGEAIEYQGCEYNRCGVWRRALNGASPVQITEQSSDQALSASPDGKSVAFMSYDRDGAKDWEVFVMAADGSKVKRLTNRAGIDGLPAWSSDGNWIAFVRETVPGSNNWEIDAIRPDGTGEQKLADLGALNGKVMGKTADQCTGWLEEQISWMGGGTGGAPAQTAKTGGAKATAPAAAAPPAATAASAASSDSKGSFKGFIAYASFDSATGAPQLMLMDLSTLKSRKVLDNASQPSLSSDGTWIAYKGWGADLKMQGLHAAALADIPGTDWQFSQAAEAQHPGWAPGDLFFSFYSRQESDRKERVMITKGAQASTIARPDMDNKDVMGKSVAVLNAGGLSILYQGCEETKCGVWQRTLTGMAPKQITQYTTDQALATSPDGKSIAFMSYDRDGAKDWEVYVMAADGSKVKRLTNRPGNDGLPTWSPDGKWIAFVREAQPNSNAWDVMAIKPDGTGEQKLFALGKLDGRAPGATPDQSAGWLEEQIAWGK